MITLLNQNRKALLDTIAYSEGTYGKGDDGYNVLVGGGLFTDYSDHPGKAIYIKPLRTWSTAAGRYQILARIYKHYKELLELIDFSPKSQDQIALWLIRECRALVDIDNGLFDRTVYKCRSRWASLPGAGYAQHENKLEDLRRFYSSVGGVISIYN